MTRFAALLLCAAVAACGGADKKGGSTTPKAGSDSQSMADTPAPDGSNAPAASAGSAATTATSAKAGSGAAATPTAVIEPAGPPIVPPNLDTDPAQVKSQVDQHLGVAKQALALQTPDPDTALREAKAALALDASNVDAAAMVAFAYYHKKLYDTAELVLDDIFKRESAKKNAEVYYVYGLIYDHTNRAEQARKAFEQAVAINPNLASALIDLGVHQLDNKQYADAQQTFETVTQRMNRTDASTLTSLASAYRGHAADYAPGDSNRDQLIRRAEATYKKAIAANGNFGPAYYDLGLLYLDADPYPGVTDTLQRLNAAKGYFDQYKNMPNADMKLYEQRTKEVTKLIKTASRRKKP
jgi:tetratricopeptide (TPR) repeat protein